MKVDQVSAPADVLRPRELTVLYDSGCPVCRRARRWASSRPQLVPLRFVAAGSPEAARRFPDLNAARTLAEITVVTDSGAVLTGEKAWIAVLWALAPTRRAAIAIAAGRRRFAFHALKDATETMRRLSGAVPATGPALSPPQLPPPFVCAGCADDAERRR
jgi:predicted DCC family thiol-disulfide oxidoreductase YuxK